MPGVNRGLIRLRRVKRTVMAGSEEQAAKAAKSGPKGGLDKVLQDIKGTESISTVTKSSYDWDTFKQEKGLEEELAQATKDGCVAEDIMCRCQSGSSADMCGYVGSRPQVPA
jgi:hypothetical protein